MNLIIVRDPMYTLPPTVYRPSFFGGVFFWRSPPTCSILRKKESPIGTARSGIIVIVIGRWEFHLEYIFTIRYNTQVPNGQLTTGTNDYLPK